MNEESELFGGGNKPRTFKPSYRKTINIKFDKMSETACWKDHTFENGGLLRNVIEVLISQGNM